MDNNFEIIETKEQPVLSKRMTISLDKLPQELGKAYNSILGYLNEVGGKPGDAAFAAYYNMDMQNLDVEMGFPVQNIVPGKGDIIANEIPAGKKAVCMHRGPYQKMAPVYEAMTKWMSENGHQPTGIVYEFYYNSPNEVPESELLTKIMFLLK